MDDFNSVHLTRERLNILVTELMRACLNAGVLSELKVDRDASTFVADCGDVCQS